MTSLCGFFPSPGKATPPQVHRKCLCAMPPQMVCSPVSKHASVCHDPSSRRCALPVCLPQRFPVGSRKSCRQCWCLTQEGKHQHKTASKKFLNFSLMFAATTNSSCGSVEHSSLLGETLVVVRDANLAH